MLLVLAQTIIPWNTYSHFNSYWLAVLFWLLSIVTQLVLEHSTQIFATHLR